MEFSFGNQVLDVNRRELRRRGELIALEPQVFDLLVYLVQNRDRVVSKADLLKAIWGDRIVSESTLTSRINAVRKAVGDSGEAQRLIRTVARKGIRFIGVVREEQKPTALLDAAPMIAADASRPTLTLPEKSSIAVLPFANLSSDQGHFAHGVVEGIITALSRIRWLFVISSFTYKGQSVDVKRVGRELGVRYVLEGSVRNAGGRLRITAQLIDAATGAHLWAEHFDGSLEAVFEFQDQVAIDVATAIGSALQSVEIHRSANLSEQAVSSGAGRPDPISAERRQLTVMSCNLMESMALASRLDPEDLRDLIAGYHRSVAEIVAGFRGFVARQLGDGVLIYFGYPDVHEDDAERAIRCALTIADTVTRLETGEELRTRVGIATSMVVVDGPIDGAVSREISVIGEAPSLATRLRDLAMPNSVLIAESTRRLVGELFEYHAIEVNGITGPVRAWQALRPSVVASRFEALRGSALTRLIGRDEEIDLLLRRWERAKTGDGQVALVSGEPGIGKSRIAAVLGERLQAEPHIRLRYFCSPYYQDSALYPFVDQLSRAAGFARDDPPASRLRKLEALLARATPPAEDVAFLADLLSLPASERQPLPILSPQRKKERTLEALVRQLQGLARRRPVIMVFEDAHWTDPTSRELLDLTVERVRSLPVLLIVTFRPEFQPPWTGQSQVSMLALNRLDQRDRAALIAQISGGKALPAEVINQIADRTDGVPLFVEELTKSVLESGLLREESDRYVLDRALPPLAIPTSLHASLLARLDRSASVRWVAQIGAAIGREFSFALLHAVSRLSEDELQASLARLVASELVFQRGTPPDAVYSFKHVLVQDAAHGSLLRNARKQLHAQIAEALEAHCPEILETQPELFAQHYAEAGLIEKSVACWSKAGRRSAARSAMAEAVVQLQKGLDQLALLPANHERQRLALEFWSALAAALLVVKGYRAPETGDAYARARELWEILGSPSEFLHIPFGQSRYHAARGEIERALHLDEDLLRLSGQLNDSAGLVLGHYASARTLMFAGRFASSRSHLEAVLALYDPISHRSLVRQAGFHPQVVSGSYLGNVLFCLGYPDQALAWSNAAIAEAQRVGHRASVAQSLAHGTRLLSLVGDNTALADRTEQLVAATTDQGFPLWGPQGTIFRGWVKVKNGDVAEGISFLRSGSAAYRAAGDAAVWTPHHTALLARACEIAGQIEEGLSLWDDALQIVERTGERLLAAELNRHKGQLLLRQGHFEAAEELYCKALSIAQEQEAKLWELRAATSLARLWGEQGRRAEARDLLTPVYGWFTEGFDTVDLKDAKALFDELA